MIFTLDSRGKPHPDKLPCGCPVIMNLKAIGLDGEPVQGATGLNSVTGWMRVQRWVIAPGLRRRTPDGRVVTSEMGAQTVNVVAPFELRCRTHGKLEEP